MRIYLLILLKPLKGTFGEEGWGNCVWSTVLWFFVALKTIIVCIGLALGAKINFTIDDKIQLFFSLYKRITSSPFEETRATLVSQYILHVLQIAVFRVHLKYLDICRNAPTINTDTVEMARRMIWCTSTTSRDNCTSTFNATRRLCVQHTSVSATGPVLWPIITGTNYPLKDWRPTFERLSPAARLRAPTETESWRTGCERVLVSDL